MNADPLDDDPADPPPRPLRESLPPWPVTVALIASWVLVAGMLIAMIVIADNVRDNLAHRGELQEAVARKVGISDAEITRIMGREAEAAR